MNAKRINAAAGVIYAAQKVRSTATGIATALEAAGLLQSPESAAELVALRIDRDVCHDWADTLAYKVAPVEVLGRHGEEGKYPWGEALELLTPAAEVDALEARHAAVLALHRKHTDSDHCFADDETWPCSTLTALGRTDAEPPSPTDDAAELRADNERLRARVAELEAHAGASPWERAVAGLNALVDAGVAFHVEPDGHISAPFSDEHIEWDLKAKRWVLTRDDEDDDSYEAAADRYLATPYTDDVPRPIPDTEHLAVVAARWNSLYPVGSPVTAYPGCRPEDDPKDERLVTRTRSAASVLGGHTAVVWVEGHSACIKLTHVDPRPGGAS
ncbi:hypothetical protein OG402_11805 [Streptomyces anulatus]|uniref:hypothetical protein n=1 Tax=Streptomyces anulatus TaxID=1892 RepID=UPI002253617D|nr:hypothetical protein [Streptomyces anulatus]MCX4601172.1 hypothetical protein [Streptomyces anulatus]